MVLVKFHTKRFAFAVGVDERDGDHILLHVDASVVAQRQRPVDGRIFDGAPEVDDLEALRKQLRHLLSGEMAVHARYGRSRGLVDVHPRYRLAGVWAIVTDVAWSVAANGCNVNGTSVILRTCRESNDTYYDQRIRRERPLSPS
jgi:hypothetical protein